MAKGESTQRRLLKVRAARINITYDVEKNGAIETKELPFVQAVVGDFGANPVDPPKRLKDRNFVNIDRDNFNEVLGSIAPVAAFRVPNLLSEEAGQFAVELQFREMDDFRPEAVVQQVAPLKALLEARTKLADLRNKLAGNDKLDDLLCEVLNSTEKLSALHGAKTAKEE